MTDLTGTGVRVLLIGTAACSEPSLPPLPPVRRSVAALSAALRERCGVGESRLRVILDPPDAKTMAEAVAEEARAAQSVLVIYYLGHGLLGPGNELYLSASGTGKLTPGVAAHQALSFSAITEAISACRAPSVAVVLDCCFSGRAEFGLRSAEPTFTLPATHGVYLLASAERLALAPEDHEFTMFSGAVISLLTQGDPRGPRLLTLDDAYDFVFRSLRAAGGPLPRRQAGDRSGELILAANPAQPEPCESDDGDPAPTGRCPYLGLSAFGVDDADLFRGREQVTTELVAAAAGAMALSSPLIVVGPSGAGKSSLLNAGLLARLREGPAELPGAATWPWLTLTPGEHPLQLLAAKLSPDRTVTADDIRRDPVRAAGLAAALASQPSGTRQPPELRRLVLVIDQLEQLFVPGVSTAERTAFLAAMSAIARAPDGGAGTALVVLALRADFYGQAAEYPDLLAAMTTAQFIVGPMSSREMRAAIEEPALTAGLRLDDGLADIILHELGAVDGTGPGPGALPLLSHALWAIWRERSGARLTMAGYRAAGRVTGAIAATADQTYGALSAGEQAAVRRMLPRLVRVGDEGPDTIREMQRSAVLAGLPSQQAARVALDHMAAARLVTLDRDTVRLSHEALLRSWPLLAGWIEADRDWLRVSQRLADDARAWRESGRDRSRLYRGGALAAVRQKAGEAGRAAELPPDAAEFLASSQRQEHRASRLRKAVITALSVLLVLALSGGGTSLLYQRQASAQRDAAVSQLLSTEADELRTTDPNLAIQLSLVAYQVNHETGMAALLASQGTPGLLDDGTPALDVAQTADGHVLAVSTGTGIRLLDTATGRPVARLGPFATGPVAIGSATHLLAAATGPLADLYPLSSPVNNTPGLNEVRDQLRLWNIAAPSRPRVLATVPAGAKDVVALALSPDERVLAAASLDGSIRIWNIADPRRPALLSLLRGDGKAMYSLAFDPHGRVLASSGADHKIRLWDLTDPAHPALLAQLSGATDNSGTSDPAMPHRVAFSSNGQELAAAAGSSAGEYPEVWSVVNPRAPRELAAASDTSLTPCGHLMGLTFTPGGQHIASSCDNQDEALVEWKLQAGRRPGSHQLERLTTLSDTTGYSDTGGQVMLLPHRGVALTVSSVGVWVWTLRALQPGGIASTPASSGLVPGTLAFNSTGRPLLAETTYLPEIRLWDLSDPSHFKNLAAYPELIPKGSGADADAMALGVALSGNGQILAASEVINGRPAIALRRTAKPDAAPVGTIRDLSNGAISLAMSRDGRLLAVSDSSNYAPADTATPSVKLFDVRDPAHPRLLASFPGYTFQVAFSPDGRMLVALTGNTMLTWDISNPSRPVALPRQYLSQASGAADCAFSPDGSLLAVADEAGALWLWHIANDRFTGQRILLSQQAGIGSGTAVAFSPDGNLLAASGVSNGGGTNMAVDLWDVADPAAPRLEAVWAQQGLSAVSALGFSPAGHILAVEGDTDITLWSTDPAKIATNLCASVGDTITPFQWKQYVPGLPYHPPCGG